MSPGQHLADHVVDRSARHRRLEPIGVADDPRGEVPAVRAAGDAHPIAVDEPVVDERVEAGHDVAHRPIAPVADVPVQECLAVALRAARVAGVDADPAGGEQLPLPHERPAVERGRPAVDLEDDRRGVALRARRRRDEPALDAAAIDLVPALDRRDEPDVGPRVAHQVADLAAARRGRRPLSRPAGTSPTTTSGALVAVAAHGGHARAAPRQADERRCARGSAGRG